MKLLTFTTLVLFSLIYTDKANAIIFIPALILIPIAKIVAGIIAGFSAPAILSSYVFSKTSKKPFKKVIVISLILIVCMALIIGVILKVLNPDRSFL